MRMRKLPWAEDFLKEQDVVIKEPAALQGKWKETLKRDVLHLEIGCGKGDYWTKMALQYPEYGWIGVEKNNNVAALAVRKYTKQEKKKHICDSSTMMLSSLLLGLQKVKFKSSI